MSSIGISPGYGVLVLSLYWAASLVIAAFLGRPKTKDQFLVADRTLGVWESAFSIAATWVWAPALFLAAQKAYTQGLAGVFWFTVPNVLCLIIFAPFAYRIRELVPAGYTLSAYMRERFSSRVQGLYVLEMTGLAVCSFAVQLLAGGKVLSSLTGVSFFWITIVLAGIALGYSLSGGIKLSVVTDYLQMFIILLVGGACLVWVLNRTGGWSAVADGLGGFTGSFGHIFKGDGLAVAWSFGLPVTVGLLAGPFGDQSFWQRAFATEKDKVKGAFVRSAFIFSLVPLIMACLGFVAAGKAWSVADKSLVNLEVIVRVLPAWVIVPFVVMLLSGLISTLDSNLCAISSIAGHDLLDRIEAKAEKKSAWTPLSISRGGMLLLAAVGIVVANIPNMQILYLFLFYGTLRASTFLPTVITLLKEKVSEAGVFYGILISIVIGLPVFSYGNFAHLTSWTVTGSLLTVLASGLIALLASIGTTGSSERKG